jgi:hypothetical protein
MRRRSTSNASTSRARDRTASPNSRHVTGSRSRTSTHRNRSRQLPVGAGWCGSSAVLAPGSTSRSRHRSNRATYTDTSTISGSASSPTTRIARITPPTASSVNTLTVAAPSTMPESRYASDRHGHGHADRRKPHGGPAMAPIAVPAAARGGAGADAVTMVTAATLPA